MRIMANLFLAGLAAAAPAFAGPTDPIYGVWMRDGHNQKLEFFDCEGHLCARGYFPPPPPGAQPALIFRYATRIEPNKWKGDLFNPENGKIYSGTVTLDSPTRLTLTGCLIAFLCQSEGWSKVPVEPPAPSQKSPTPRRRVNNP
ncbi:DUF2147 domain-containing protein [Methylosinus trichosporium OB3b]|uniref:DUF2147 domain-containing protein n=2 Tax=Methylocystaceae TaxID=31993 RepID=A0A2D2CVC1_METT3|nr:MULTISPECIES: DUF2147 domain-containing protein [Methylosinus]ATQ66762.1 DUF2147 domain-containing protein [Methylosinus trichosporium OB3b]OBS51424.1 hypothetical protein A8B73_16445 [Methylosinus sp. 3S-1]